MAHLFASLIGTLRRKLGADGGKGYTASLSKRIFNYLSLSSLRLVDIAAGLVKDILLTRTFGLGLFMDSYFVVMSYLDIVGGYFQQLGYGILVPLYNDIEKDEGSPQATKARQDQMTSVFLNYTLLSVLLLGIGVAVLHQTIATTLAPKLANQPGSYLDWMLLTLFPISVLFQGSCALRLLLVQQDRYALFHLPSIISTVVFIALAWGLVPSLGVHAVIWAFVLSQLIQFGLYVYHLRLRWHWLWQLPELKKMLLYALPNVLMIVCFYLYMPLDNYFLAKLAPGELSAYNYGAKVVGVIRMVTVFSLQMTMIPSLMKAGSRRDGPEMHRLIRNGVLETLAFCALIIPLALWLGPWMIALVFERGQFDAQDTANVVATYNIFLSQLPFFGIWMLVTRSFNSLYMLNPLLLISLIALVLRAGFDWVGLQGGMAGIALWSSIHYYVVLAIGLITIWVLVGKLPPPNPATIPVESPTTAEIPED